MTQTLRPLCRKSYLAKTVRSMGEVLRDLGQEVPAACSDSVKSLEQRDHAFFAETIFKMADTMYGVSLGLRSRPVHENKWWQVTSHCYGDRDVRIGAMVFISDASFGQRYSQGLGQLLRIDREPWAGAPRIYEEDGGPARMSNRYLIRLLDGSEITWTNASMKNVADHRYIEMIKEITREYA